MQLVHLLLHFAMFALKSQNPLDLLLTLIFQPSILFFEFASLPDPFLIRFVIFLALCILVIFFIGSVLDHLLIVGVDLDHWLVVIVTHACFFLDLAQRRLR